MSAEKWIEAAVRSYFDAPASRIKWDELTPLGRRHATEAFAFQLRHFLPAAEADGVVFVRVPDAKRGDDDLSAYQQGLEVGWNNCRAAVLAGKVAP